LVAWRLGPFAVLAAVLLALTGATPGAAAGGLTITSLTPTSGPAGLQSLLTIQGTGFPQLGDCEGQLIDIKIDGMSAPPLELPTATQVRVAKPVHSPGTVEVVVTNVCDGTSDGATYTYFGPGLISGGVPARGFGLFVFAGGADSELLTAIDCDASTLTFWATNLDGEFVTYIPAARVLAVNGAWDALFPHGIPANTALIGRCT
jgi:hypothetical protein